MSEYIFEKPYEFEGKTYEKIEFDLEGLKGRDISDAKKQFASAGNFSMLPAADSDFCAYILAKVTKQPVEFFFEMPAKDFTKITGRVSSFLIG